MRLEQEGVCVPDLLPLHALTGCDTVSQICTLGKVKPLNILKKDKKECLEFFYNLEAENFEELYGKCVSFISRCYNMPEYNTMNQLRYEFWLKRVGSAKKVSPPLECLPPTDSSFREHVKRAVYQLAIWSSDGRRSPPILKQPSGVGMKVDRICYLSLYLKIHSNRS